LFKIIYRQNYKIVVTLRHETINNGINMNKIVLITGASSGIGEGCARKFASNGAKLILNARSADKLEALAKELTEKYSAETYVLPFDVRDRKAAFEALVSLPEEWKAIDVLVNNAGLVIGMDKEHEGCLDEWDIVIDTNIKSLLAMTRMVVPGMVERGRGHIINIGSIAGDAAYPGGSVYCATKAAVKALSDGLRIDLVDTPLRVTNVKPGLVETNFSVIRFRGDKEKADNVYKGIRPLTGDDIAEVVYFAASVPEYMQIAEVLVMPTNQATGTITYKK
jgi:NADP-dependent 3-hydroxy acid dehydrogenase YdfG